MRVYLYILMIILFIIAFIGLSGCEKPEPGDSAYIPENTKDNGFHLPPIDISQPVPQMPISVDIKKKYLGNIEITYNNVIYAHQIYSLGGDLFIHLKNNGDEVERVYTDKAEDIALQNNIPSWNRHFFSFQNTSIILQPGEERILHYFASMDDIGQFDIDFNFWQRADRSDRVTINVIFYSDNQPIEFPNTAIIYGYIYDKQTNQPLKGVEVTCCFYNGREYASRERTDDFGRYILMVPGVDDVETFFGKQELGYSSLRYFIYIDHPGYEYFYKEDIEVNRGENLRLDIDLEPAEDTMYTLNWEDKVHDYFGFFWLNVDSQWNKVFATQAKHPPELNRATNVYLYDIETGEQLWRYPVDDECWGSAITGDGVYAAAGSHDGHVYLINTVDGSLKWSKNCGGMNREVEFSHDGKLLLTGPYQGYDFVLFNVEDGAINLSYSGFDQWLRNSRFTRDDSKFVVGLSGGYLAMFNATDGSMIWENWIGEFPLFLAIDKNGNTYACGKGRTLFSFDPYGNTRWSYRIPDHTVTSGGLSEDGSKLIVGTVGGWIYFIDTSNGSIIWRDKLPDAARNGDVVTSVGHNAVSISSNGRYIAVGGAPANLLVILNEKGTRVFEHTAEFNDDPILNDKWNTIGEGASESSQKGVMCTVISENGEKVIVAYGDNYIRCFMKQ